MSKKRRRHHIEVGPPLEELERDPELLHLFLKTVAKVHDIPLLEGSRLGRSHARVIRDAMRKQNPELDFDEKLS